MTGVNQELLLDTHVWLWMSFNTQKIKNASRVRLEEAAGQSRLYISAITLFEVANLLHRKKIALALPIKEWFDLSLAEPGVQVVPVTPEIAVATAALPYNFHRDPSDRLIASTAIARRMVLCTHDAEIIRFGEQGIYDFMEI